MKGNRVCSPQGEVRCQTEPEERAIEGVTGGMEIVYEVRYGGEVPEACAQGVHGWIADDDGRIVVRCKTGAQRSSVEEEYTGRTDQEGTEERVFFCPCR